jgi:DNA-binding CsgD family transcriptional regulator
MRIQLTAITFDAGTQVRAALDQQVVADYAEAMTNGATFPSIVLFHDGSAYYIADGYHRFMAAQRLEWREIDAEVRAGAKNDALWFALGANRANGHRLTERDVKHAIKIALTTWPERSGKQISEQLGCSQRYVSEVRDQVRATSNLPDRVVGRDGKTYPASRPTERPAVSPQHAAIVESIKAGKSSHDICTGLGVRAEMVATARRELGVAKVDNSREAVAERRERIEKMAGDGYSSRQIASAIGMTDHRVRKLARKLGVVITADTAIGKIKRHDSNRIIERIVLDAENLTEGTELIDFEDVDRAQLTEWVRSLSTSRDKLGTFIRTLTKEQQKHGEAA